MSLNIYKYQIVIEISLARDNAIHALSEYRQWLENPFIGQHLGEARTGYVIILRRRVRHALENYRFARFARHLLPPRAA